MLLGVDVGYTYTKTVTKDEKNIFRSTISEGSMDINSSVIVEYLGKEYTIGEKGSYSVDLNKTNDDTFLLCLFTAIAQAMKTNSDNVDLVTGLPVAYYSKQKQFLKDSLEGRDIFIKIDNRHKVFYISKCLVFPQSAGLFTIYPELFEEDLLVIDIGGMTVDVSYFEGLKLMKYATYPMGMLKLYGELIQELNSEHALNLELLDAERILRSGYRQIDMDLKGIILKHTEEILRPIKLEFPYKTVKKAFTGGGALVLKEHLPGGSQIKEECIFDNARAFYEIGAVKYGYS